MNFSIESGLTKSIFFIFLSTSLNLVGQLFMKQGMMSTGAISGTFGTIRAAICSPAVIFGIFIADRYPGGRIEDTMATVLARAAGFMLDLESQVSSINRCAPISNNTEATRQMDRYLSGQKDLESKFGQTVAIYVPMSNWSIIETGRRLAIKEIFGAQSIERFFNMSFNALRILGALPRFLRIRYAATNANSEDPGVSVSW